MKKTEKTDLLDLTVLQIHSGDKKNYDGRFAFCFLIFQDCHFGKLRWFQNTCSHNLSCRVTNAVPLHWDALFGRLTGKHRHTTVSVHPWGKKGYDHSFLLCFCHDNHFDESCWLQNTANVLLLTCAQRTQATNWPKWNLFLLAPYIFTLEIKLKLRWHLLSFICCFLRTVTGKCVGFKTLTLPCT